MWGAPGNVCVERYQSGCSTVAAGSGPIGTFVVAAVVVHLGEGLGDQELWTSV